MTAHHATRPAAELTVGAGAAGRWIRRLALVLWMLIAAGITAGLWFDELSRRAGRSDLTTIRAEDWVFVVALAGMAMVGALLAHRRPRHPVGWLMLALAVFVTVDAATDSYARYGLLASPGAAPAVRHVRALGTTFALWPACIGLILLLTPTGTLPSPRWRWWVVVAVTAPLLWTAGATFAVPTVEGPLYAFRNPYHVPALAGMANVVALPAIMVTLLGVVVGGGSLVVRFRRARGEERQQLRWVAAAAVVAGAGVPVAMVGIAMESATVVGLGVLGAAAVLCVAVASSILRYRLYDLDRVVSRTVAYGLLTLLLTAGYAAVVLALGQLVGSDSTLAVAGATLAMAAAFQPARHRIQGLVDRHFNRRSYDAAVTIAAFGTRLRDEVDLDTMRGDLLGIIDHTMQPTAAALWLAPHRPTARLAHPE